MPYLPAQTTSIIQGPASDYGSLPTPASAYVGQMWYVTSGSGGLLSGLGVYKYPKGLYSPNASNIWELVPFNVKVSEDSVTLVNITSWSEYIGYSFDIFTGDRLIYNGKEFKNLTGTQTSTAPDIDTTNWDYAFPQGRISVAKAGGDFTSIKAACDSIVGSSASNPFFIDVFTGEYFEDPFSIPDYSTVTLNSSVVKPNNLSSSFINLGTNAEILQGDIDNLTNTGAAIVANGTTGCTCHLINVENGATGFLSENGAQLTVSESSARSLTTGFWCNNAFLAMVSNSATITTTAIRVDGVGLIVGATFASLGGTTTDILQTSTTASMRFLSMIISPDKLDVQNMSLLKLTISSDKEDDEAFIVTQEFGVGTPEQGQEACIGKGDSYTRGMLVYTETSGSVFTDVSEDARSASGSTFTFPGTGADNAIYISSSLSSMTDVLKFFGIKTKVATAMVVGAGEVVSEYWNGSIWAEFNGSVIEAGGSFYPFAKQYFEATGSHQVRYDKHLSIDNWTKNDPMSLGTDYFWVRYRVVTAVTSVPQIEQFKLHADCYEINEDGFPEHKGLSRGIGRLPWDAGLFQASNSSPGNQDLYIGDNLSVGRIENEFVNGNTDRQGFLSPLPRELDTSSPINFAWSVRTDDNTVGNIEWVIRWAWTSEGSAIYGASGDAPTTAVNQQEVTLVAAAPTSENTEKWYSVDLDVSNMVARRENGFGDTLWVTLERTGGGASDTHSGDVALVAIDANYLKWAEGGHI